MTHAVMHSTTGTARGTTVGSCRPGTTSFVSSIDNMSKVSCGAAIDDAGLNPTLNTTGMPVDKPPSIPPELLVFVTIFPS
jgi:hypothetical protein